MGNLKSLLATRSVAQSGRVPGLGPGSRRFEPCYSDKFKSKDTEMKPKFRDKENKKVVLPDGKILWASRAVALVITIFIKHKGSDVISCLMTQRGKGCPDEVGKWVMPCGYLNWNERLVDGARRELFEETGFDVSQYVRDNPDNVKISDFSKKGQPWFVNDGIHDGKQNVSSYFGIFIEEEDGVDYPLLTAKYSEKDEIEDLRWVPLGELGRYDIAFNHEKRIPMYKKHVEDNILSDGQESVVDYLYSQLDGSPLSKDKLVKCLRTIPEGMISEFTKFIK